MSQNDLVIDNQSFPATRSDINSALQALGSLNSGSSAPATTYANMLWYDTTNNTLKMRSEADDAWISVGYLDQSSNAFRIFDDTQVVNTSGAQTGLIGDQATAVWEAGTGTTESLVSPAKVKAGFDAFEQQLGVGQTWQDLTGSRAISTVYQNTTGRPIQISANLDGGTGTPTFEVSTDNSTWVVVAEITNASGDTGYVNVIIPNGHYYRTQGNIDQLNNWAELR